MTLQELVTNLSEKLTAAEAREQDIRRVLEIPADQSMFDFCVLQQATINGLRLPKTDWDGNTIPELMEKLAVAESELRNRTEAYKQSCIDRERLENELNRIKKAIMPGSPKWVPTPEQPQRDFYVALIEESKADGDRNSDLRKQLAAAEGLAELAGTYRDRAVAAEARCERLEALYEAVVCLTNPDDEICGIHPGPERDELQRAYAAALAAAKEGK